MVQWSSCYKVVTTRSCLVHGLNWPLPTVSTPFTVDHNPLLAGRLFSKLQSQAQDSATCCFCYLHQDVQPWPPSKHWLTAFFSLLKPGPFNLCGTRFSLPVVWTLLSGVCPSPTTQNSVVYQLILLVVTLVCLQLYFLEFPCPCSIHLSGLLPCIASSWTAACCSPGLPPVDCSRFSSEQVLPRGPEVLPPNT